MAKAMAAPPLAPRPMVAAWSTTMPFIDNKDTRPGALKQLQHSAPAARSRRERPCDGCRRRKSRCVLQDSRPCVLCEFHKQECTFIERAQPRKRKLEDGTTVEGAVKRSPTITQPRLSTSTPTPPTTAATTTTTTTTATPTLRSNGGPLPPTPQARRATANHASGTARGASMRMPFAVDESLSLQRHRHCKLVGQTTALDATLIGLGAFNDQNESESRLGRLRQVTRTEYFTTHDDADVPIPDDEARALADIDATVGQHGPALIDIYFRTVHPSFPIMQKQAFLDRHRHGDKQFNPPLLAAMYLLALTWWEHDPVLAPHPKPDVARLEYIAITSLTVAMQRPKMSAVQAGLLLLQRPKSSTWTLTVQLVAVAQDIGLHLDCSDWSIPVWERRLRKRLAWALYIQDKWSALMHGRPSHINAADWAVPPPTVEDFDESVPPLPTPREEPSADGPGRQGRSIFMQMIALTSIMADVCSVFYSQTAQAEYLAAGRNATQLVLNRAKPVQIKLKDWFAKLPPECKMDSYTPGELCPTGYLHLGYFATEISIHRRIVQSLDPSTADPYLLYICRSAAKTRLISAMDFVNRLRPEHLDAFWYFASAANFALIGTFGALLLATSPGREEADFYATRLSEFKWALAVSAREAGWIYGALDTLEATADMLKGLPEKPYVGQGPGQAQGGQQDGVSALLLQQQQQQQQYTNGFTNGDADVHIKTIEADDDNDAWRDDYG